MSGGARSPTCWIIAGPNGAGKTTFALEYLPEVAGCRNFVNADLIAAGMAPLSPQTERVAAGRLFLREIARYERAHLDFGFETTLAGRAYLRLIQRLREAGWRVELIYLMLPDPAMARLRVAERVAHGGHDISQEDIKRRFYRSLFNLFERYLGVVNRTECISNIGEQPESVFVRQGDVLDIHQNDVFEAMQEMASHGD